MIKPETISAIRFGFGLAPGQSTANGSASMIRQLSATVKTPPRISLAKRTAFIQSHRNENKAAKDEAAKKTARRKLARLVTQDIRHLFANAIDGDGFGERLTHFWADHFTVAANGPVLRILVPDFIDGAIRPNIAGSFPDLLTAATLHPAMLIYLNQAQSVGPNSRAGKLRNKGLNENLSREILELHTLGVGPDYYQSDVRGLAYLLTGLSVDKTGFKFRRDVAEPGLHTVLGKTYGGNPSLNHIKAALNDIALHPATARHLAQKLIIHFVGGIPNQDFVEKIANAYLKSNGNLSKTYAAMLDDPRSWSEKFQKVKPPFDFLVSSLRAAKVSGAEIKKLSAKDLRKLIAAMQSMGQTIFQPNGPDGWPENPESWITPPGLSARIAWAGFFAAKIEKNHDPRDFLETTLADAATPLLQFAVAGSEARAEGLALTLVSPEFNRR